MRNSYFRHYNGKLLIKPMKQKVLEFCKKVGKTINSMRAATQEDLIKTINPLLRGFANYYRGVVSKETFSYIDNRVYKYLWNWCKRKHLKRRIKWVKEKYFHFHKGNHWTFMCYGAGRRKSEERLIILYKLVSTPIIRHIKVKGDASPDDASLNEYWTKRREKTGKIYWAKGSKYELIAKEQNWKCPVCGESLFNGEQIETHHIVSVREGGTDDAGNLTHLHKACHKQVHSKSKSKARSST